MPEYAEQLWKCTECGRVIGEDKLLSAESYNQTQPFKCPSHPTVDMVTDLEVEITGTPYDPVGPPDQNELP